ncbi:MAG: Ig-like domain-containing protein [Acidobacteriota bacterium]
MDSVRRTVAILLVLGQMILSGCVSVRQTGSRPADGAGGGVAVRVFPDDAARKAGAPGPSGVLGELERREGGGWRPVFRSLDPSWTVAGLAPGTYRVRFPAMLDESGNVVRMDEKAFTVEVREGRITETEVTLRHVDKALVAAGVVVAIAAAIVLADFLDDNDLPDLPLPPPEVAEAAFYITMDIIHSVTWQGLGDNLPPAITSHFPAQGALVAARRPKVIFAFSEPLAATEVEGQGVTVLGERSGLVAGDLAVDVEQWWLVWTPRQDLEPADTFHVTLAADAVEDARGNELREAVSFTFGTAP